jgi:hypothetical protein
LSYLYLACVTHFAVRGILAVRDLTDSAEVQDSDQPSGCSLAAGAISGVSYSDLYCGESMLSVGAIVEIAMIGIATTTLTLHLVRNQCQSEYCSMQESAEVMAVTINRSLDPLSFTNALNFQNGIIPIFE